MQQKKPLNNNSEDKNHYVNEFDIDDPTTMLKEDKSFSKEFKRRPDLIEPENGWSRDK